MGKRESIEVVPKAERPWRGWWRRSLVAVGVLVLVAAGLRVAWGIAAERALDRQIEETVARGIPLAQPTESSHPQPARRLAAKYAEINQAIRQTHVVLLPRPWPLPPMSGLVLGYYSDEFQSGSLVSRNDITFFPWFLADTELSPEVRLLTWAATDRSRQLLREARRLASDKEEAALIRRWPSISSGSMDDAARFLLDCAAAAPLLGAPAEVPRLLLDVESLIRTLFLTGIEHAALAGDRISEQMLPWSLHPPDDPLSMGPAWDELATALLEDEHIRDGWQRVHAGVIRERLADLEMYRTGNPANAGWSSSGETVSRLAFLPLWMRDTTELVAVRAAVWWELEAPQNRRPGWYEPPQRYFFDGDDPLFLESTLQRVRDYGFRPADQIIAQRRLAAAAIVAWKHPEHWAGRELVESEPATWLGEFAADPWWPDEVIRFTNTGGRPRLYVIGWDREDNGGTLISPHWLLELDRVPERYRAAAQQGHHDWVFFLDSRNLQYPRHYFPGMQAE
jgi:hypothetical protein